MRLIPSIPSRIFVRSVWLCSLAGSRASGRSASSAVGKSSRRFEAAGHEPTWIDPAETELGVDPTGTQLRCLLHRPARRGRGGWANPAATWSGLRPVYRQRARRLVAGDEQVGQQGAFLPGRRADSRVCACPFQREPARITPRRAARIGYPLDREAR